MDERDLSSLLPQESPHHGFRGEDSGRLRPAVPAALTIAISREAGARGGTIGRRVGRLLGWQVYDQELLDYVMQDSNVQQGLMDSLSEVAARWVEERLEGFQLRENGGLPAAILNVARTTLVLGARAGSQLVGFHR